MEPHPSVHYDTVSQKWAYEAPDGSLMEFNTVSQSWIAVVDDAVLKAQQEAYSVDGVDESAPTTALPAKEARAKRKAEAAELPSSSKAKRPPRAAPQRSTAVYITALPPTTTLPQLVSCFSKGGVILEDGEGNPKVKMYRDEQGRFKGDALVVYLMEESVGLAVRLLDDTELVVGSGDGNMKVAKAVWEKKEGSVDGKAGDGAGRKDPKKQKGARRADKLKAKLVDWSSDEEASLAAMKKFSKTVVLRGMFTLAEIEEDATLLLDLKEEVREECETLGEVTNVTIYDLEEEGIMTIRFKDDISAKACILKNNNRFFAGRSIAAFLFDGSRKYRKTGHGSANVLEGTDFEGPSTAAGAEDGVATAVAAEKEKERLEKYAQFLERDEAHRA